jgi:hypothetical protein
MMTDKDIQNLIDLFESKIHAGVTAEEALNCLVFVGILDKNGEYTPLYQQLLNEAMGKE